MTRGRRGGATAPPTHPDVEVARALAAAASPLLAELLDAGPPRHGLVDGRHYSSFVEEVKSLKREGRLDQAEALLLRLLGAVEEESRAEGVGVAPWYYEQLAVVYARRAEVGSEIQVLERFARQRHARGEGPARLLRRLARRKGSA